MLSPILKSSLAGLSFWSKTNSVPLCPFLNQLTLIFCWQIVYNLTSLVFTNLTLSEMDTYHSRKHLKFSQYFFLNLYLSFTSIGQRNFHLFIGKLEITHVYNSTWHTIILFIGGKLKWQLPDSLTMELKKSYLFTQLPYFIWNSFFSQFKRFFQWERINESNLLCYRK